MSTVKTNNVQVGQSVTATNNFTLYQPTTPDGTVRLGVGNTGATTSDVITATSAGNVTVAGTATATAFSGNGSAVSSLNASNLSTGTVATARLATGTANSTTFLRGDQTWAAPTAPSTADVLTATASASVGAVGTYALLDVVGAAATTEGDTAAGSGLAYSGVLAAYGHGSSTAGSLVATAGANPSGTWRCMGRTGYTVTNTVTAIRIATLWLRIS